MSFAGLIFWVVNFSAPNDRAEAKEVDEKAPPELTGEPVGDCGVPALD